jgi:gliding motility-associated lipoprotein GldH
LKNKHLIFFLLPMLVMLFSCNDDRFYEQNISIKDGQWHADDIKTFEVEINDTSALYDFFINVRNTGAYPDANLFLFINTHFPDQRMARDTVELFLADPKGKWLGEGSGDIYFSQILFRRGVQLPVSGVYRFEFEQAMRTKVLKEIIDIGLRIEKREIIVNE